MKKDTFGSLFLIILNFTVCLCIIYNLNSELLKLKNYNKYIYVSQLFLLTGRYKDPLPSHFYGLFLCNSAVIAINIHEILKGLCFHMTT